MTSQASGVCAAINARRRSERSRGAASRSLAFRKALSSVATLAVRSRVWVAVRIASTAGKSGSA